MYELLKETEWRYSIMFSAIVPPRALFLLSYVLATVCSLPCSRGFTLSTKSSCLFVYQQFFIRPLPPENLFWCNLISLLISRMLCSPFHRWNHMTHFGMLLKILISCLMTYLVTFIVIFQNLTNRLF